MKSDPEPRAGGIPRFLVQRLFWLFPLLAWTLAVLASMHVQIGEHREHSLEVATTGARDIFNMIVLSRAWNAGHGGVYVPVTDKTQPNPYLKHPRRDLTTLDGQRLTMINPAFMTRQLSEMGKAQSGTIFHITSLKPIRPMNGADAWETRALMAFEGGTKEMVEVVDTDRMAHPLHGPAQGDASLHGLPRPAGLQSGRHPWRHQRQHSLRADRRLATGLNPACLCQPRSGVSPRDHHGLAAARDIASTLA